MGCTTFAWIQSSNVRKLSPCSQEGSFSGLILKAQDLGPPGKCFVWKTFVGYRPLAGAKWAEAGKPRAESVQRLSQDIWDIFWLKAIGKWGHQLLCRSALYGPLPFLALTCIACPCWSLCSERLSVLPAEWCLTVLTPFSLRVRHALLSVVAIFSPKPEVHFPGFGCYLQLRLNTCPLRFWHDTLPVVQCQRLKCTMLYVTLFWHPSIPTPMF